jgi:nucleoside-diphosphate-sugar epimerase
MGSINSPHKVTDIGTTTPFHPRAPYIEGKRIGETITFAAQKRFIDAKIVRLSLLYGPGFKYDDSRVMFEFIKKASVGDIELLDDGKALRTYCYISDGIELIIRVLLDGEGYLYNIGGHSKVSILEIAELVAKEFNSKVIKGNKINHLNAPNIVEVDTSSTELEFNKTEYVGFSKGLAKTISWYKSNYLTNK